MTRHYTRVIILVNVIEKHIEILKNPMKHTFCFLFRFWRHRGTLLCRRVSYYFNTRRRSSCSFSFLSDTRLRFTQRRVLRAPRRALNILPQRTPATMTDRRVRFESHHRARRRNAAISWFTGRGDRRRCAEKRVVGSRDSHRRTAGHAADCATTLADDTFEQ